MTVENQREITTFQVQFESTLGINTMSLPREKWDTWDPTLISEVRDTATFGFFWN